MAKRGRKTGSLGRAGPSGPPRAPAPLAAPVARLPPARPALLAAAAVSVVALGVYLRTLAPTVTLVDSGELIVAAHGLGVAHPPGFPLWAMLAHAATLVPLGSVAVRVNAASAVAAALAAGLLTLAAREALAHAGRPLSQGPRSWTDLTPTLYAGLSLAFTRTLWSYATVAEVYALNTLLLVAVWLLMFSWRRQGGGDRPLLAAAFLFGLALGVHHVTIALSLPALAVFVCGNAGLGFFRSRRLATAAAVSVAGLLLVYAYLPWAASRAPVLDWGNPTTLERIVWHVTGRQYQAFFAVSGESVAREAGAFIEIASRQFGPPWLPLVPALAVLGLTSLQRRDRTLLWTLVLMALADAAYGVSYSIAEDKDAYYLPAFVAITLAAAFGAEVLLSWTRPQRRVLVAAALLLAAALPLAGHFRLCDRSRYRVAEEYLGDVLEGVPQGALVLTADWQVYSPLLYLREIEGWRRDVAAVDVQLLRRSWYFDHLRRDFPDLMGRARAEVDAFLEDLLAWESDPDLYQRNGALNQRINTRYHDMIFALIDRRLDLAQVYMTREVAQPGPGPDPELASLVARRYALVPHGLVFEATRDHGFRLPPPLPMGARAIFDRTIRVEPDDVVALKVRPVYVAMAANRGFYLAGFGAFAEARSSFEQALALDPDFGPAREGLARAAAGLKGGAQRQR